MQYCPFINLVSTLLTLDVVEQMLPLHQSESLNFLQKHWVFAFFDSQPLDQIEQYFGSEIGLYFAWLGHLTTALWAPAVVGVLISLAGGFNFIGSKEIEGGYLSGTYNF